MTSASALALLAQAPAGGRSTLLPFAFQIVAIFAIFYFVMIRPQQKQRKDHEERLRNLKRGDEVVTSGGIIGKVVHIAAPTGEGKSATMDDRITIKSDESRLVVERGRIAKVLTAAEPAATPAPASK
jgi:preprotein translocase subunit YajC